MVLGKVRVLLASYGKSTSSAEKVIVVVSLTDNEGDELLTPSTGSSSTAWTIGFISWQVVPYSLVTHRLKYVSSPDASATGVMVKVLPWSGSPLIIADSI